MDDLGFIPGLSFFKKWHRCITKLAAYCLPKILFFVENNKMNKNSWIKKGIYWKVLWQCNVTILWLGWKPNRPKSVFWPKHTRTTTHHSRAKVYRKDMGKSYPHTKNQPEQSRTRGSASHFSIKKIVFWRKHTRNTPVYARIKVNLIDMAKSYLYTKFQVDLGWSWGWLEGQRTILKKWLQKCTKLPISLNAWAVSKFEMKIRNRH